MSSRNEPNRHPRERFEEFVRHILAVPKSELEARLAAEKRRKRKPPAKN